MKASEAFEKWEQDQAVSLKHLHDAIDHALFNAFANGAIFGIEEVGRGDDATEGGSDE